jgi:hypothetical protein
MLCASSLGVWGQRSTGLGLWSYRSGWSHVEAGLWAGGAMLAPRRTQSWHHAVLYSWVFHNFFLKPNHFEVQQNPVLFSFIAYELRL